MSKVKVKDLFNIEKGSLQSSKNKEGEYNFITASSEWKTHESYTHDCEALIFAMGASGSLGRTHYVNGKFISSDLCFILTPKEEWKDKIELKLYFHYFNFKRNEIVKETATGTSKKAINQTNFSNLEIDYIDNQKVVLEKIEKALPKSTLLEHTLAENIVLIKELRDKLYERAIRGKIVPQINEEEPSSILFEKIKEEKQRLIKEKKIRRDKASPEITTEEKEFDIPESWLWVRLSDITTLITDGKHGDCRDKESSGYYFVSAKDIVDGKIVYQGAREIVCEDFEEVHKRTNLEPNDILVPNTGASIGKIAITEDNELTYRTTFQKSVAIVKPIRQYVNENYLVFALKGILEKMKTGLKGTAMVNLLLGDMRNFVIPLPPYSEQLRIVDKMKQLLNYCEELERKVIESNIESANIMKATLEKAFEIEEVKENVVMNS